MATTRALANHLISCHAADNCVHCTRVGKNCVNTLRLLTSNTNFAGCTQPQQHKGRYGPRLAGYNARRNMTANPQIRGHGGNTCT
jgi:hypothetical protein